MIPGNILQHQFLNAGFIPQQMPWCCISSRVPVISSYLVQSACKFQKLKFWSQHVNETGRCISMSPCLSNCVITGGTHYYLAQDSSKCRDNPDIHRTGYATAIVPDMSHAITNHHAGFNQYGCDGDIDIMLQPLNKIMFERGREVANPLVPLLFAGSLYESLYEIPFTISQTFIFNSIWWKMMILLERLHNRQDQHVIEWIGLARILRLWIIMKLV